MEWRFLTKNINKNSNISSIILGKALKYVKIQESLRSENLAEYYLCKGMFLFIFLLTERYWTNTTENKSLK